MEEYRLELRNVTKKFGEVHALEDINFQLGRNEVVGLLGDNGAGKSTLIKIVTGYYQPTSGEILFNGEKVDHLTVSKARQLGVEAVYQERALAELQTLWRNIFLGREIANRWGLLDITKMRQETHRLMSQSMGFTSLAVNPESRDALFPENGGLDRETGQRNIRQRLTIELFGKTVSGERVTYSFPVNLNFFVRDPLRLPCA